MQYLLVALLMFVMSACSANNQTAGKTDQPGTLTAKVSVSAAKSTAKTVAYTVADITKVKMKVSGPTIPTASQVFDAPAGVPTTPLTLSVYPGKDIIVDIQALDASGAILFEGFATNVVVTAGATTDVGTISPTQFVAKTADAPCLSCHADTRDTTNQNLVANFKQSGHYSNDTWTAMPKFGVTGTGCAGCHGPQHNVLNPATSGRCYECHSTLTAGASMDFPSHNGSAVGIQSNNCNNCHVSHDTTEFVNGNCISCHAFAQNSGAGYVQDNNGVRAITAEFAKWSHHVTGVTLNDAHCAACHLEGQVENGKVLINTAYHMNDAKTHLRNADTDADMQWDPAAPNHTTMDNFCMTCHDGNGATSPASQSIQAFINSKGLAAAGKTASALNPFGDTISNRYDKMQRPGVIDVSAQFDTTNNSHHAVKGPRYTGRTREAGSRQIASPATFASNSSATLQGVRSTIYDAGNLNQLYTPLANTGGEAAPRTGAATLGDDSTLHCGDCHTVGQWKVGSSTTASGALTPVAIGAHGSSNEYMLRNSIGTDERHTQNAFTNTNGVITYTNPNGAFLVCYNCHSYNKYGSIFLRTGVLGGHVGEYDQSGRCNGVGNTLPFNGFTTGKATDGTQFVSRFNGPISKYGTTPAFAPGFPLNGTAPAGEQNPDFGNIFGIQCNNCHNSGAGNAYGGIHGSARNTNTINATVNPSVTGGAYIDGMGNTTKVMRFLPGLGNAMHVPGTLGGFTGGTQAGPITNGTIDGVTGTVNTYTYTTGGISNDTNWEQKHWNQTATTVINNTTGTVSGGFVRAGAGCYTLGGATAAATAIQGPSVTGQGGPATELFDTWGGCDDHGAAQGMSDHGPVKKIVRPVTY
jgi:hypothetical protein